MARSSWKPTYINLSILKKIAKHKTANAAIPIWCRSSTILPVFKDKVFNIYNGKNFTQVKITDQKINHKFGEFAPTKKRVVHKVLKTKKK